MKNLSRSIDSSRSAKRLAMYSYQLINRHLVYCSQIKYYDNPFYIEEKIISDPLFDERIPKRYIIDFVDALGKEYRWEKDKKKLTN